MPFCDVVHLFDYWREYPPTHILLRGFTGYEPPKQITETGEVTTLTVKHALGSTFGRSFKVSKAPPAVRFAIEKLKEENGRR